MKLIRFGNSNHPIRNLNHIYKDAMVKEFVHDISTKIAHQKASAIDTHLARFLTEQGFKTDEWTVQAMKQELKEKGFEIFSELKRYSESEVYTFKLCKVYAKSSLHIPNPTFTI